MLGNLVQGLQPSFELLFRAVTVAMQRFRQIFIVIDALDECSDTRRLLATLRSMIDWDLDGFHVFLSSRRLPSIEVLLREVSHSHRIDITDFNSEDIKTSISKKISERLDYLPDTVKSDVWRAVVTRANGV